MNHNTNQANPSSSASPVQSAASTYFTGQAVDWIWDNAWRILVIATGTMLASMVAGWLLGKTTYLPVVEPHVYVVLIFILGHRMQLKQTHLDKKRRERL